MVIYDWHWQFFMHLTKDLMRQLIEQQELITHFDELDMQLTANGVDVRLAAVVEVLDGGKLAVAKSDNKPPRLGSAIALTGFEDRLDGYDIADKKIVDNATVKLEKLKPYLIITCERVNTPSNLMFHIQPRSSLFRMTQSMLGHAFGEAGYKGFLTFMLVPTLDCEIELGARFAQLSFTELKGEASYESQKESSYQGGKLF